MRTVDKVDLALALTKGSRAGLEKSIGFAQSTISKALNGASQSVAVLKNIETVLGVPIWSESPVDRVLREEAGCES
ncbi:MAG: hypothetical protein ACPGSB_03510 [Opitutales bacterium]